MGKTNFTFARVLVVALLAFAGLNQASAQCNPATAGPVVGFTETICYAFLDFQSGHCN
jgi:hypothetical protein